MPAIAAPAPAAQTAPEPTAAVTSSPAPVALAPGKPSPSPTTGAADGSVRASPLRRPEAPAETSREATNPAEVRRGRASAEPRQSPASTSATGNPAPTAEAQPGSVLPAGGASAAEEMPLLSSVPTDRLSTASPDGAAAQARGTPTGPHHIARQMADALHAMPDSPVEVSLSPEELGKVRLTLHTVDGGLSVVVQAERPETLDLMRRNIDSLARDFREMGYSNTSFDFGSQTGQNRSSPTRDDPPQPVEPEPANRFHTATTALQPPARTAEGGLDLRI